MLRKFAIAALFVSSSLSANAALAALASGGMTAPAKVASDVPVAAHSTMVTPCTLTYESGVTVGVWSCPEKTGDLCCSYEEWLEGEESCPSECTCSGEEDYTVEVVDSEDPILVRGVPVLWQQDTEPEETKEYPVGCGPIAVASLMLYYHGLGWDDLAADHENASNQIEWQDLALCLAEDYLDTWIRKNQSPTYPWKMESGIEDFVTDMGYTANVTEYTVTDSGSGSDISTASAEGIIKQSLLNGRPVILGFDVSDEGGGIGGGGDNFGFIDHYAVIVGIDDTVSPATLYVNMGWTDIDGFSTGKNGNVIDLDGGIAEFDLTIGSGQIYLWLVQMNASEKNVGGEECPTTQASSIYTPSTDVGASFEDTSYDSWPLINRLVAGDLCDVIGGETSHTESRTRTVTETVDCGPHYWLYDMHEKGEEPFEVETFGGSTQNGGGLEPGPGDSGILDRIDP